jgi:hypothetical protein
LSNLILDHFGGNFITNYRKKFGPFWADFGTVVGTILGAFFGSFWADSQANFGPILRPTLGQF